MVVLCSTGQPGGTEAVALEILRVLRGERPTWRLSLVAPTGGPLIERAADLGVETSVLPFPPTLERLGEAGRGNRLRPMAMRFAAAAVAAGPYVGRLRRRLAGWQPTVVHAHGFKMQVLGALARPPGSAVVWHVHDYVSARPFTARALRFASGRCAALIANSHSVARDLHSVFGETPVTTIHNVLDLDRFRPEGPARDLDRLSGLPPAPPGTVRVGLVGTLARWKGHGVFMDAIATLPSSLPIRAYVVGGALYRTEGSQHTLDELRQRASDLGLDARLGFTGFVDEPSAAMRALDVVVHASTEPEPFGMVIAEAMACGRAVITSHAGGAMEIVQPDVDVIRHRPGRVEELAAAIGRLAGDAGLRRRLGRAARLSAERLFDATRLAGEIEAVYRTAGTGRR